MRAYFLEAKFSLRHLVAMALSDVDTSNTETFTDACARDPVLVTLRPRVHVEPDGPTDEGTPGAIVLADGRTVSIAHDVGGARDRVGRRAAGRDAGRGPSGHRIRIAPLES